MFECRACLRECVRALVTIHRPPLARGLHVSAARRRHDYFTESGQTGRTEKRRAAPAGGKTSREKPGSNDKLAKPFRPTVWRPLPDTQAGTSLDDDGAPKPPRNTWRPTGGVAIKEDHLRTEMKYLQDPYKLADHVAYVLSTGADEKALALIRLATRGLAVTVSWNHVINHYMQMGHTKKALDIYNEMKKRAQRPDSHTYVLLLRGLAKNIHAPGSLGKALSLYHAMSAPRSRVSPSIIHTNAVLKVCARADDLESMWDIASKLPERGPHAANCWTYTTLLQAIRENAKGSTANGENPENAQRRELAIVEGRRLWSIVVQRWREGDIIIDDTLVNAMGKLLLIGSRPRDWDDVLSLVQQTMDIPRLIPRLGSIEREEDGLARIRAPHTPADMKNDNSQITNDMDEPRAGSEFDAVAAIPRDIRSRSGPSTNSIPRRQAFVYAAPSNMTLSLLTEAGLKLIAKRGVSDYWSLLTDPNAYGLTPDAENCHMLLRVLRQARASAEALALITTELPRWGIPRSLAKTYRIAMSACARDAANPNAFDTACKVLDVAQQHLREPDLRTLGMYLDMAAKTKEPGMIVRALDRLQPGMVNLKSYLNLGPAEGSDRFTSRKAVEEERQEAIDLMRKMIGCYDLVLYEGARDFARKDGSQQQQLPEKIRTAYMERRSRLAAFVTREHDKRRKEKSAGGEVEIQSVKD